MVVEPEGSSVFGSTSGRSSSVESTELSDGAPEIRNDKLSPLFQATIEATEEAIYNSLLKAVTVEGRAGFQREALSIDRLLEIGRKFNRLHSPTKK